MFLTTPSTASPSLHCLEMTGLRCSLALLFQDRAARDNDVAATPVHLEDLERLLHPHQRAERSRTGRTSTWLPGKNATAPSRSTVNPPFTRPKIAPSTSPVVGIGFFELVPGGLAARLVAADNRFAARVLDAVEEDLDFVDQRRSQEASPGSCEFFEFDPAFHLVADIDDRLSGFDGNDLALDDRSLVGRVDFEAFV